MRNSEVRTDCSRVVADMMAKYAPKPVMPELLLTLSLTEMIEKHGAPNRFHASELTRPGLRMEAVKRIGQKARELTVAGQCVIYSRGYFRVEKT